FDRGEECLEITISFDVAHQAHPCAAITQMPFLPCRVARRRWREAPRTGDRYVSTTHCPGKPWSALVPLVEMRRGEPQVRSCHWVRRRSAVDTHQGVAVLMNSRENPMPHPGIR